MRFSMLPEVEQKDSLLTTPFCCQLCIGSQFFCSLVCNSCISFYRNRQIPEFLFSYDFIFEVFTRYILRYDYIYPSLSNSPHSPPMCPSQFHLFFCLITHWVKLMLLTCVRVWGQLPEPGKPTHGNTLIEERLPFSSYHELLFASQWERCQIYLDFSSFLY